MAQENERERRTREERERKKERKQRTSLSTLKEEYNASRTKIDKGCVLRTLARKAYRLVETFVEEHEASRNDGTSRGKP